MAKEIKKETDWRGREKDVIYEDGTKVGETRHETDWRGRPKDITYDNSGNKIGEIRHETTSSGTSKEVTYDTHGNKISETKYKEGIFGEKKGVIYEDGKKIGELKTEKGFFGGRKQILHEYSEDVDLARRATKERPTIKERPIRTEESFQDDGYYKEKPYETPKPTRQQIIAEKLAGKKESKLVEIAIGNNEEDLKSAASKGLVGIRGRLYISEYNSERGIKKLCDGGKIGLYSGVTFVPPDYSCTYKCTRCGHEWDDIKNEYSLDNPVKCIMGCSSGDGEPSLLGLYKIIKGLITGKEPFGYGELIKREKL